MKNKTKIKRQNIKTGDRLSRLSYLEVINIDSRMAHVKNEEGKTWTIDLDIVEAECYSASHYDETKPVNRTELIEIFNGTEDNVYTVSFNKQPKVEDAFEAISNKGKLQTNAIIKKLLKEKMQGEERILTGYTIKREIPWGRSMVVDLKEPDGDNIRQVDHRTLNWLICKNVRYVVSA